MGETQSVGIAAVIAVKRLLAVQKIFQKMCLSGCARHRLNYLLIFWKGTWCFEGRASSDIKTFQATENSDLIPRDKRVGAIETMKEIEMPIVHRRKRRAESRSIGFEQLPGPRGVADNLKKLPGVWLAVEKQLNGLGIFHYSQIAALNKKAARNVGEVIGLPGRIPSWIAKAKELTLEQ